MRRTFFYKGAKEEELGFKEAGNGIFGLAPSLHLPPSLYLEESSVLVIGLKFEGRAFLAARAFFLEGSEGGRWEEREEDFGFSESINEISGLAPSLLLPPSLCLEESRVLVIGLKFEGRAFLAARAFFLEGSEGGRWEEREEDFGYVDFKRKRRRFPKGQTLKFKRRPTSRLVMFR